ncbi:hypothetical protein DX873_00640 [Flagellimonas nanhaiensis]|uniref:Uncharacterized protein n=1 Tax=Flagellimonas nanhaiensis TaxID=2292706 RepID=A0A371JSD4_9FLAO|nr:hypothetical protein DX873_00640 [Allomuricauda nanhaiensis]
MLKQVRYDEQTLERFLTFVRNDKKEDGSKLLHSIQDWVINDGEWTSAVRLNAVEILAKIQMPLSIFRLRSKWQRHSVQLVKFVSKP